MLALGALEHKDGPDYLSYPKVIIAIITLVIQCCKDIAYLTYVKLSNFFIFLYKTLSKNCE